MIVLSALLPIAACGVPLGDPQPRPVGIGRTADGQFRFVVPLCEGETVSAFEVKDRETWAPLWRVSQPTQPDERRGIVVLGRAQGFAEEEVRLTLPLPHNISVSAAVPDAPTIGRAFLLDEVPEGLAGTDQVIDLDGRRLSEEEFRQQVTGEYC
ncbi:hypothetical protein ACQPZZ_11795 [Microbispora sp. CA-135349]|uniref:hypothetical protein n=1 Tax=Microbispora sp. CA-135349 TaxID=3239953 RepID=UPI003D93DAE6